MFCTIHVCGTLMVNKPVVISVIENEITFYNNELSLISYSTINCCFIYTFPTIYSCDYLFNIEHFGSLSFTSN